MANSLPLKQYFAAKTKEEEEADEKTYQRYRDLISTFPGDKGWSDGRIYQFQGFWYQPVYILQGVLALQEHFKARPTDTLLITSPKSGTTWLKALAFAIVHRTRYASSQHPLLTANPHDLIPYLELELFKTNPIPDLDVLPSPRIFAAHIPYASFSESMVDSGCKIVYLCRNPRDAFISLWFFMSKLRPDALGPLPLDEAFELFCRGVSPFGSFWDHVSGYWKESLKNPQRILFLHFEELKKNPNVPVKRLAEFLGYPFSLEEEREGVVDEILSLCSFENLSNLEVNKTGLTSSNFSKALLFRKGEVGDSKKYLTPQMIEVLDQITENKFKGSGFAFYVS